MSSPKRRKKAAAAEVFAQQNVVNLTDEVTESISFADSDVMPRAERNRQTPPSPVAPSPQSPMPLSDSASVPALSAFKTSEELQLEKEPLQVRETGFLFWKRIIVPPNAYVVHTVQDAKTL